MVRRLTVSGAPAWLAATWIAVVGVSGCGGGQGSSPTDDADTRVAGERFMERAAQGAFVAATLAPVADAGRNQNVSTGTLVALDGTGSYDPERAPLTYSWSLPTKPLGSTATLAGARTAKPTFTADQDGTYVARLVVGDGTLSSAADAVMVVASSGNSAPVAHAGRDRIVPIGALVALDGRASSDADGNPLTLAWTFIAKPLGSAATLSGAKTARPTFTADVHGSYVARLVVNDGLVSSVGDRVTVVADTAPVASAGRDQTVRPGALVTLRGTGSQDADGDPLTYAWALTAKPPGSSAALLGATTANTTFTADKRGTYTARIVVNDGTVDGVPDAVTVVANTPPIANAGRDRGVATGALVSLDGTGSSDPDGDQLTYTWALVTRPAGSVATLTGTHSAKPTFTADRDGTYVARLVVGDGLAVSPNDFVTILATPGGVGVAQQAYVKPSNSGGRFGHSVALSGDTMVVGAYLESSAATGVNGNQANFDAGGSGAVYVFTRVNGVWRQQAYLKASNIGASDNFGYSVAISGNTIVVGAPQEDSGGTGVNGQQSGNNATDSGAAYVFTRRSGVWSQQAYLKPSNTGGGDRFGHSVAISGNTVIVGAYLEDSNARGVNGFEGDSFNGTNSGAAYVFVRSAGTWSQQAYLKASNAYGGDSFGLSVAISGDTAVVGAPTESSAATGVNGDQTSDGAQWAGAAYVFDRVNGHWSQSAYLKALNTDGSDAFGTSVATDGDTVVVGAYFEDGSATGINGNQLDRGAPLAGAAYVFTRAGGAWRQQAYLKPSNTQAGDTFGGSVAVSGDLLVVGARWEDSSATGVNGNQSDNSFRSSGAAYLYRRIDNAWTQFAYLKASNTGSDDPSFGDEFGAGISVWGNTLVVGAHHEGSSATGVNGNQWDNNAGGSGAAYVFVFAPP